MTHIFSIQSEIERQRRENSTAQQRFVMLGDGRGNDPAVNLYADKQHLWARDIAGSSESGFTATGAPFKVLAGSNTSVWIGKYVWLSYQTGPKEWKVELSDPDQMTDIGMSMHLENPNDPHNQFHRTEQLLPLRAQWIGGMKISVQGWQYVRDNGTAGNYGGTSAASGAVSEHVDATSFVPGTAAQHRYILVAFNTKEFELGNDPLVVYASTPKSWFTALGKTDEDECLAQMGPRTVSIWLFRVATGDTDNRGHASDRDKRQWLNTPPRVLNITSEDTSVAITETDGTFDLSVSGGMASFTVAGDSGTPFDIEDADTLTFEGASGIDVVTDDATQTVIIDLEDTAVTPGSYTNLNATIDQQGRVTSASNGTAPVNPPFVDTQTLIKGSADATKLLRFEVDGFTTGATRVLTPPDADATIVGETTTQNISNKTINTSDIGTTTPGAGYFSALRLKLGGFFGIFTHSNSADRTYTLQNASGTLAFLSDIPAAPTGVTRVFNAYSTPGSTTHTIPAGCFRMEVTCVGGGGGGGSGRRGASATNRYGGGGGAAGAVTHKVFSATELGGPGTNITVFVGSGGSGGTSVSVDNTNGNNGNSGTDSRFGGTTAAAAYLSADGGGGGSGGTTTAGTGGTGTTTLAPTYQFYGSSGAGANFSVTPVALKGAWGPGGGGGGGGINSLNANTDGGAGATGSQSAFAIIAGGGGTGGSGGFGGNGANGTLDGSSPNWFGAGGGGGGGGGGGAGLKGGAGGLPGGGGGGGGGNLNGNASGSGTEGGGGAVIVVSYCYT